MITTVSITLTALLVMFVISALAYFKAPADAKMPMQWGLDGTVNWRANKIWAVLIFPIALIFCNGLLIFLESLFSGKEPLADKVLIAIGAFQAILMLALHIGYLYFALRDVGRNGSG